MRAELCVRTLDSAAASYPALRGAIVHSDRGSQYTSGAYRAALEKHGIRQSMNSDAGRCHDNARCESMWARMKCELFYGARQKILCKRRQVVVKETGANQRISRVGHNPG